ncbi:MAG: ABC transporter ATP-binding protein, partial [Planctomycetota bacterium]
MIAAALRGLEELLGKGWRWRWTALVAVALFVTAIEVVGAFGVYALLALIAADTPDLVVPLVGDLSRLAGDGNLDQMRVGVALFVVVFFALRSVLLVWRAYIETRILAAASVDIGDRLLRGYLAMPYRFHTTRNSSELIRNTFTSTQQLQLGVVRPLVEIIAQSVLVVGLTLVLVAADPRGSLVAAVVLGLSVWFIQRRLRPRLAAWGRRAQDASSATISAVQQSLGGIRDIKLLSRESTFADEHLRQRIVLARTAYLSSAANALPRALIEMSLVYTIIAMLLVAILAGTDVNATLSTLGLFAYAGIRLQPSLQAIVGQYNVLRFNLPIVDDLARDQAEISAWLAEAPPSVRDDTPHPIFARAVELVGVGFDYAPDDEGARPALAGVDLEVRRGEFLGICGPTGGGKSTLLDVIVGLLVPTKGSVRVDGVALSDRPAWWWAQLGVVSQAVFLTDDTLARNIAFGIDPETVDQDRLARCIARAQLDELVQSLPEGLKTVVGERGIRLSGGQRQRVAIARALYREPAVVVLDEGTSALDAATETAVVSALDELATDRTLIAVAHRLATIRHADRIIVVDQGHITAAGTFDELLVSD